MKKICFVCSVGGHLTDLIYLLDIFQNDDYFFVTHDNQRTRALKFVRYFLPSYINDPLALARYPGLIMSIVRKERPDLIISNGAEIAVPVLLAGKILGITTVFMETYTRINQPTITGRLVYPLSDLFLVFWPELLSQYGKKAQYWGGLFETYSRHTRSHSKEDLVFVTVGMHYIGFDRLVRKMDEIAGKISHKVMMQIGSTAYEPKNADFFRFDKYDRILDLMSRAKLVVTQGAMSSVDSLEVGTPVIVVPRLKEHGEVINDHQLVFGKRLEGMGLLKHVDNIGDLEHAVVDSLATDRTEMKSLRLNKSFAEKLRDYVESC